MIKKLLLLNLSFLVYQVQAQTIVDSTNFTVIDELNYTVCNGDTASYDLDGDMIDDIQLWGYSRLTCSHFANFYSKELWVEPLNSYKLYARGDSIYGTIMKPIAALVNFGDNLNNENNFIESKFLIADLFWSGYQCSFQIHFGYYNNDAGFLALRKISASDTVNFLYKINLISSSCMQVTTESNAELNENSLSDPIQFSINSNKVIIKGMEEGGAYVINLYDNQGKCYYEGTHLENANIDINNLTKGFYILNVSSVNKNLRETFKIVIN